MKILKKAILAGLAAPVVILCGCSTVSVTTDYDPTASFASYRTYALEPPANAPLLSPSADAALRSALHENLAARGIREVGVKDKPDLAVVPQARLQQRYTREQYNHWGYGVGGWPFGAGYYGTWIGEPYPSTTIESYIEGTLILDFVETSHQTLVFRGIGKRTVSSPKSNAEKIEEAVEKIVAKLPAAAQSPLVARQ
jgi:Domain of unknown function (DUF4136)